MSLCFPPDCSTDSTAHQQWEAGIDGNEKKKKQQIPFLVIYSGTAAIPPLSFLVVNLQRWTALVIQSSWPPTVASTNTTAGAPTDPTPSDPHKSDLIRQLVLCGSE